MYKIVVQLLGLLKNYKKYNFSLTIIDDSNTINKQ